MSEEVTVAINGNASENTVTEAEKNNQPDESGPTNEVEKVAQNNQETSDEIVKTETKPESTVKETSDAPTKDIETRNTDETNEKSEQLTRVDDPNNGEISAKSDTLGGDVDNTDTTPTVVDIDKTNTDTVKDKIVNEEMENKTDTKENEQSHKKDGRTDDLNKVDTELSSAPNEQGNTSEHMHDGTDINEEKSKPLDSAKENNAKPNDTTSIGKDTEIKTNDATVTNDESSNQNDTESTSKSPTNDVEITSTRDAEKDVHSNTGSSKETTEHSDKDLPVQQNNVSYKKSNASETSKSDDDNALSVQGQAISSSGTHSEVKDSVSKKSLEESTKSENGDNLQSAQDVDEIQNELDKAYGDGIQEPSEVRISSAPESTAGSERRVSTDVGKIIERTNTDSDDNEDDSKYDEDFEDDVPNDVTADEKDINADKKGINTPQNDDNEDDAKYDEDFEEDVPNDTTADSTAINVDKEGTNSPQNDSTSQSGDKSHAINVADSGNTNDDKDDTSNVADRGDESDDKEKTNSSESDSMNQSGNKSDTTIDNTGGPTEGSNISESENRIKEEKTNSNDSMSEKERTDVEIEEDCTSVSVVVDSEGMPKVVVTTVPDRPPSSQDSLSGERDSFDDADTGNVVKSKNTTDDNKSVDSSSKMNESDLAKTDTNDDSKDRHETEIVQDTKEKTENAETTSDSKGGENDKVVANSEDNSVQQDESASKNQDIPSETSGGDASKINVEDSKAKKSVEVSSTEKSIADERQSESKPVEQEHMQKNDAEKSAIDKSQSDSNTAEIKESKEDTNAEKEAVQQDVVETVKETPLEKLLKRNVEIDGTVDSITDLESMVVKLLESMKSVLKYYMERLTLQPLKDLTQDMDKFRGDFTSINEAYQRCSNMSVNINQHLKALRFMNEDVKSMISRKFQSEDLCSWIDASPEQEKEKDRLYEERIAAEKQAMSKAADARQAVAQAAIGVVEAKERAAEMEMLAAEAEVTATKAAALAKTALITAQEARKAAEERRIAEEDAKRRNQERARAKAEEEKKKEALEEMHIYQEAARKGVSVEDEAKRFKEEKARKEAARRNPKNWPMYSYHFKGGDFDPGVGCAIRAMEGSFREDDVTCEYIEQSSNVLPLRGTEQLVSNITRVKLVDESRKLQLEEPMSIALPICINRPSMGKEAVVKQLTSNGTWRELPTADVQFEDYKDQKFLEGRCRSFGTFAVVVRLKKDKLQFQKKGNRQISSVDSRVSFVASEGTFTHNTNATLEVQPIEMNIVSELKIREPEMCEDLISCSPIVNLVLPVRTFDKQHPLNVCFPLPHVASRPTRPLTGIQRETTKPSEKEKETARPKTARAPPAKYDESVEHTRFLYKDDKNGWTVISKVELERTKARDITAFSVSQSFGRMLLLRTKEGVRDSTREKIAVMLENAVCHQHVKLVLKQRQYDAADLILACTTSAKVDTVLKQFSSAGYDEGPPPTADILLREGQNLYMKFRGNISCVSANLKSDFIFNKHIDCIRTFHVEETDKFAQKSLHCYRGFVQICTKTPAPRSDSSSRSSPDTETVLTELLVEMSKPDLEPPKPLKTAPVPLKDGPLSKDVLRHIAFELGTEWRDVALNLGLKPMRIQAILRQNINKETTQTRLDMLITWLKRIPKSVDKIQLLSSALQASGRGELAEEVRCRGNEFKRQRVLSARVSHLRQAFVKVAKARDVCSDWQEFAKGLGVKEEDIQRIQEAGGSGQEKCYSSLEAWKEARGQEATIPELANYLKLAHHERLSRDVESIIASHC